MRGATSSPVPPDDPLVAQSSDPVTPRTEVNAGPFLLRAISTANDSTASAFSGAAQSDSASGGSATATAEAAHDPVTGVTRAEATLYQETSLHADVMAFLAALDARGDRRFHLTSFGQSPGGRDLPLVVMSAQQASPLEPGRSTGSAMIPP